MWVGSFPMHSVHVSLETPRVRMFLATHESNAVNATIVVIEELPILVSETHRLSEVVMVTAPRGTRRRRGWVLRAPANAPVTTLALRL